MTANIEHIQEHDPEIIETVHYMRKELTVEIADNYEDMKIVVYYTEEGKYKYLEYIVIKYENLNEKINKPNMDYDFFMAVHEILDCMVKDKFNHWDKISQDLFVNKITDTIQDVFDKNEIMVEY